MYMRTTYTTLLAFLITTTAVSAQDLNTEPAEEKKVISLTPVGTPKIKFEENEWDFGTIRQGEKVTHVFKFVNDGSAPLVIGHVSTPCGCTAPKWSYDSIAPGDTGEIVVSFNSAHKMGPQTKTLKVTYNSEFSPDLITIQGKVIPNVPEEHDPHEGHNHE